VNPPVVNPPDTDTDAGPLHTRYVLTNRMNLNAMLSSRIIGSRDFFPKYYPDLLELCPGRIPVLSEPPAPDLIDLVSAQVRSGPALLEFPTTIRAMPRTRVDLADAIPMSAVSAIHLPSDSSLREHRARRYRNIHPHDHLLKVTPHLFTGSVTRDDVTRAASCSDGESLTPRDATTWKRIDRMRGALSAAVASADDPQTLRKAADTLHASALESNDRILSLLPCGSIDMQDAERYLAAAILETLMAADVQKAWDPSAVIEHVRSLVHADDVTASFITANLGRVTAIVSGEAPFTPFKSEGRGLASAKAFLLVLLREELTELLNWPRTETGADQHTRQLAAVFAGALRGLTREAIAARNASLDDLTANWACTNTGEPDTTPHPRIEADGDDVHLLLGEGRIRTVRSATPWAPRRP
jgi:hypothetical protein